VVYAATCLFPSRNARASFLLHLRVAVVMFLLQHSSFRKLLCYAGIECIRETVFKQPPRKNALLPSYNLLYDWSAIWCNPWSRYCDCFFHFTLRRCLIATLFGGSCDYLMDQRPACWWAPALAFQCDHVKVIVYIVYVQ